jgi:hypothetical protein
MPKGTLPATISYSDTSTDAVLPDERFANAAEVRETCKLMIRADQPRAWMRARVDGLVNGFPTVPKGITQAKGLGWFPRVNFREAEGLIATQQTPIYDLETEVDHCIDLTLDIDASSSEELDDWENTIQEAFTWLLHTKWRTSFNFHRPLCTREMLVHGMGAHVWPTKDKWIPRTPKSGQILFPEGVSLDFENEGDWFMLRDFVPSVDVYKFIRNEAAATKLGWFPKNVWNTLANAYRQNQTVGINSRVEEIQRRMRSGDIGWWSTSQVGLWLNWLFVKEYEGGISLYCVEENIAAPASGKKDDKGYLYAKRFQFAEWPLTLFPYDIGDGDLHSVQGLGVRTKDFYELSNRINNAMAVQVLISAFPQVRQTQPNVDPDKLKLMRTGVLSIIPYGLESAMQTLPPLNNTGLALQKHLRDTLESNNQSSISGGGAPEPKDRETKYSFALRAHDSARVSNGQQSLFESNLQNFYEKTFRRLLNTPKGDLPYQKMAEAFRQRCLKPPPGFQPVPEAALKEKAIGEIQEVTSTGAGSAAIRLQAIQLLLQSPVYMNAPVSKQIAAERALVASTLGGASVEKFARSVQDDKPPDIDESFAMVENGVLAEGDDAVIGDGQNDLIHATSHLQKGVEVAQACEAGQEDKQKCIIGLQKILQHAGQHLANLQKNKSQQPEYKQLAEQWRQLARYLNHLTGQWQFESQQQQMEGTPQQQLSEQGMIDMQKVQQDSQIKQQKAQGDMALKFRKAAFNERLADVKTASQIQRDHSQARFDQGLTAAKAVADVNTQRATTAVQ